MKPHFRMADVTSGQEVDGSSVDIAWEEVKT